MYFYKQDKALVSFLCHNNENGQFITVWNGQNVIQHIERLKYMVSKPLSCSYTSFMIYFDIIRSPELRFGLVAHWYNLKSGKFYQSHLLPASNWNSANHTLKTPRGVGDVSARSWYHITVTEMYLTGQGSTSTFEGTCHVVQVNFNLYLPDTILTGHAKGVIEWTWNWLFCIHMYYTILYQWCVFLL